jgi:hypothetical protein
MAITGKTDRVARRAGRLLVDSMRKRKLTRADWEWRADRLTPRRPVPVVDDVTAARLVSIVAPAIEAAGSVQRAAACGLIGGSLPAAVLSRIPASRGGSVEGGEVEWAAVVAGAVSGRRVDMERMRAECARVEKLLQVEG